MKKYSNVEQKKKALSDSLRVKLEVYINPREEKRRKKEKERLHKNFHKTINGR